MVLRDVEKEVSRWWKSGIRYLSLHCHHQNDSCIKMGSAESHFHVSLIVIRDKVTRHSLQNHSLFEEKRAEAESSQGPSADQPNTLPLGPTGSLIEGRSCG